MATVLSGAISGAYLAPASLHSGSLDGGRGALLIQHARDRGLSVGVRRSDSEGDPATPSLLVEYNGYHRFKWVVRTGSRGISVRVKNPLNLSPRPSIVIKANADVGLGADVEVFAGAGTGWVTIGPALFTPTVDGVVWVELRNNALYRNSPCWFDHIVST